jgi:hypothetical protein
VRIAETVAVRPGAASVKPGSSQPLRARPWYTVPMTIVAVCTGREAHPLHPVLTAVTGTERAAAAAVFARAPGVTLLDALPGHDDGDGTAAPVASADALLASRARIAALGEHLEALDVLAAVPFPDAGAVARALDDLLVARARSAAGRRPSPGAARTRVAHAEAHLAHVEGATRRRAMAVAEGGGLEELHRLLIGLEQRAAGPMARRSFRRRVATLRDEERALLGRLGFASFSDYRSAVADANAAPGALDRAHRALDRARAELSQADQDGGASVDVPVHEAAARLVAALQASGPVPRLDLEPDGETTGDAIAGAAVDDPELEHHARGWLAELTRAEARRRQIDVQRRELAAELALVQTTVVEADAIAAAETRLSTPAAAVDVELAILAALAAHRRQIVRGPFVVDGALDGLAADTRAAVLDLLASLRGEPQVVVLTDRPEVAIWAHDAHPGKAAVLCLDGRIPTRLDLADDHVIDLDALAASAAEPGPARSGEPEGSGDRDDQSAVPLGHHDEADRGPAAGFDDADADAAYQRLVLFGTDELALAPSASAEPAGAEGAAVRPLRRELTSDEVDRYGLDLFHLAVDEEPLPKRRLGW